MSERRVVFFDVNQIIYGSAWWASNQLPNSLLESSASALRTSDQVFVFDVDSLRHLQEAGTQNVTACIAPGASTFFSVCEDAELLMLVAEPKMKRALSEKAQSRCYVLGSVGPDLERSAPPFGGAELGEQVVIVDGHLFAEFSPMSILMQLSLVEDAVTWLVDVGQDPQMAELLRERAPAYDIDIAMFSLGADAGQYYADAMAVVCASRGRALTWASALGLPRLPVGTSTSLLDCVKDSMLAVSFDALSMEREARIPWKQRFEEAQSFVDSRATQRLPLGLPEGIEKIVRQPEQERGQNSPRRVEPSSSDVEAELKALKDAIEAGER